LIFALISKDQAKHSRNTMEISVMPQAVPTSHIDCFV